MPSVESYGRRLHTALAERGHGWDAFPTVLLDPQLDADARVAGVVLLLSQRDEYHLTPVHSFDPFDDSLDQLGRPRGPWRGLARHRLAWTTDSVVTALDVVTEPPYDDRRVTVALRGAHQLAAAGLAGTDVLDRVSRCVAFLDSHDQFESVEPVRRLARRVLAAASPPELLDLSLVADGDTWAEPARTAARSAPADEVAGLVRVLGSLGPGSPSRRWCDDVATALAPTAASALLRRWLELASIADPVPERPGSRIGLCLGVLFTGTNNDLVRAACWATTRVPEPWPAPLLGELARRGARHNGAAGFPEALALAVAGAAVGSLADRDHAADRQVLADLRQQVSRRDLLRRIETALGTP